MIRSLLLSASLANLVLLRIWSELLTYTPPQSFTLARPPVSYRYTSAFFTWLLLTAVFLLFHRVPPRYRWIPLSLTAVVAAKQIAQVFLNAFPQWKVGFLIPFIVLVIPLVGALFIARTRAAAWLLTALSPLLLLTVGRAVLHLPSASAAAFPQPGRASKFTSSPPVRTVWLLFDELDQAHLAKTPLPEFDRLRATSISLTRASAPANSTIVSIPSLLTGRIARTTREQSNSELFQRFGSDSEESLWGQYPDFFFRSQQLHRNTAVTGWFLPYCRVLASRLTTCVWLPMNRQMNTYYPPPLTPISQLRSLFETSHFSPFGQSLAIQAHNRTLSTLIQSAQRMAADPTLHAVFLHLPTPHSPYVYDPQTKSTTKSNPTASDYPGQLPYVDLILGQIRKAMEDAGLWNQTIFLVSSDHGLRSNPQTELGVPWILKLPGQSQPIVHRQPFQTVDSMNLLLEIAGGAIETPSQAVSWIAKNSAGTQP